MSQVTSLPSDKWIPIKNRRDFPDLDFEYVPQVFSAKRCSKLRNHLEHQQYTDIIMANRAQTTELATAQYAWFSDNGSWKYVSRKNQRNFFTPLAWPEWLRSAALTIAKRVECFNGRQAWNACLVSYESQGGHLARHRDPWNTQIGHIVYAFIDATARGDEEEDGVVTLRAEPEDKRNTTSRRFTLNCLDGSVVVLKNQASWIEWDYYFQHVRPDEKYYCLSFRLVDPLRVSAQNSARPALMTKDALSQQRTVMPFLSNTVATTATKTITKRKQTDCDDDDDDFSDLRIPAVKEYTPTVVTKKVRKKKK